MTSIKKDKRQELLKYLERLQQNCDKCLVVSPSFHELNTKEILIRRYRILSCIKLLQIFGIYSLAEIEIPDIHEAFGIIPFSETENEYEDFDKHMEQDIYLCQTGKAFLSVILKDTNWKILYMEDLSDYMKLEKTILNKIQKAISIHLGLILSCKCIIDTHLQVEEFARQTGIEADREMFNHEFFPTMNVILLNEPIEKMLQICQKEEKCREWEEYKEFIEILPLYLFDAFFADYSICSEITLDEKNDNKTWEYFNYMLGEGISNSIEIARFSNLCYESVIRLLLADVIAEEFFNHYEDETRGIK